MTARFPVWPGRRTERLDLSLKRDLVARPRHRQALAEAQRWCRFRRSVRCFLSSQVVLLSIRDSQLFARSRAGIVLSIPILFHPPVQRRSTPAVVSLAPLPPILLCARPSRGRTRSASASRSVTPIRLRRSPHLPATAKEERIGNHDKEAPSPPLLRMTATGATRAILPAAFDRGTRTRARAIWRW